MVDTLKMPKVSVVHIHYECFCKGKHFVKWVPVAEAELFDLDFELLTHPPYSLDLSQREFFCSQISRECSMEENLR